MFARPVTMQIRPGKMDEAIRIYRESVVPTSREQKGCRGMQLLTDAASGKCVSISTWDSDADQQASEDSGHMQRQIAGFGPFMAGPPVREAYTVGVKTRPFAVIARFLLFARRCRPSAVGVLDFSRQSQ